MNQLNSILVDEASPNTSVYRWYGDFNRGRSSLEDEFCEGGPKAVVVSKTIAVLCLN